MIGGGCLYQFVKETLRVCVFACLSTTNLKVATLGSPK